MGLNKYLMKKLILGIILGSLLTTGISYAYRIPKPQRITDFNHNGLVILNQNLEDLWDLTNGRYNLDVKSSTPTSIPTEGTMIAYSSGGVYRIYIYLNGGWRVWTSD
jgi:hypothetical protein